MINAQKIYIIGAGISGLVAAIELEKKGYAPIILEQTNSIGGRVKTDEVDGVFYDHGFQVILTQYPAVKNYINLNTLNLTYFLPGAVVYYNGKAHLFGDPIRNASFLIPTIFSPLGTLKDKWKIFTLANKLKRKSIDEIFETSAISTLAYLKQYGFSNKIIELFFKPFYTGIFLEPYLQTSSRMFEFIFKMFAEGKAALPKKGIQAVAHQLQNKLKNTQILFNQTVTKIENNIIFLETNNNIEANKIIIATAPTFKVNNVQLPTPTFKSCTNLYFECSHNALPKPIIGLIANTEALINNIFFLPNTNIVSVTLVKPHNASNINNLADIVKQELKKHCNIDAINFLKYYHIKNALPVNYNVAYQANSKNSILSSNIFLAGDYLANGSLNAAMLNGKKAAENL